MYWASPWRRECGWEESLVPEGFYNLTSSSWNTEVTSGGHLAQLAAQSKQSQLQVRSAMCPTLPWDGESLTVSSDMSHHPGNRYLLFPGVHPNPPKLQCVAMGSCDLSPGTVGRSSPDFSAALCGSPEPFFTPLTDPFQLPSVPVDMKHPKIMNYSSCALTEEEKNKDLPPAGNGLSHKMWFTLLAVRALWIIWHWVQTSPACARSSASREVLGSRAKPCWQSSSATLRLSLVVPGMTQGVRAGEEDLNPSPHTAREVQSPPSNPDVVTQAQPYPRAKYLHRLYSAAGCFARILFCSS